GENHPHWAIIYLGILYRGAVVVPLDPAGAIETLGVFIENSQARLAFVDRSSVERFRGGAARVGREIPVVSFGIGATEEGARGPWSYEEWIATPRPEGFDAAIPPATNGDTAIMIYTSGTTGVPKAVPLTHGNIVAETGAVEEAMGFSDQEVILSLLPLFHAYSQIVNLWIATLVGATAVYIRELSSEEILRGLKEGQVTALTGVPRLWYLFHKKIFDNVRAQAKSVRWLFGALLETNGFLRDRLGLNLGRILFRRVHEAFGGRMRLACSAGSSFDAAVARDYHKLGFTVLQAYGLTETSGAATATRFEDNRVGSVGKPLGSVEIRIDEPNNDGIGEVLIRGPIVMPGYYQNPEANAAAFTADGWFRSGDLGRFDREGHLYITGRKKEVIVLPSGKNVYPEEVEAQYLKSPLVSEVCVMGVRDAQSRFAGAEKLVAVVVPDAYYLKSHQITNARHEIKFHLDSLGRELPEYQRVREYLIRTEPLPRTPTRKIRRFELQKQVEAAGMVGKTRRDLSQFVLTADERTMMGSTAARAVSAILASHIEPGIEIHPAMNLELDLGLDSLARAECVVGLEHALGIAYRAEETGSVLLVRDLVELTERTLATQSRPADGAAVAEGAGLDWGEILADPDHDSADLRQVLTRTPAMRLVSYLIQRPIYWLARLFLRLEVEGREELLKLKAPFLICPNHQSYLDSFLVCSTYPRQILDLTFHVGAKMYFASRWTAWLARSINVVPVDANVNLLRAMRAGAAGLRAGKILNIYPEGHRTYDGQLHDFKLGAAILATELNLPIVPVAIDGAWRVLPRDSNRLRLAKVRISFGKPVYPERVGPVKLDDGYQEMTNEVKRRIQEMLGRV
ncbi:MAG: AMP-binding protein, partial [Acidobacteriota bacterium]